MIGIPTSTTPRIVSPKEILRYQLAFVTPGISPRSASSRKQILQIPNFRIYARDLPQRKHRLYLRTLNFGFLFCLTISAVFATRAVPPD